MHRAAGRCTRVPGSAIMSLPRCRMRRFPSPRGRTHPKDGSAVEVRCLPGLLGGTISSGAWRENRDCSRTTLSGVGLVAGVTTNASGTGRGTGTAGAGKVRVYGTGFFRTRARTHDLVSVCIGHELAGFSNMPQVVLGRRADVNWPALKTALCLSAFTYNNRALPAPVTPSAINRRPLIK